MTMGNEQVICPKANECGDECFYPIHKTPHKFMVGSCAVMTAGHACPACILVPATPASVSLSPDELLTDEIASFLLEQNKGTYPKSTYSNQAETILQKCHQSESAEIDKLNMTLRTGEQQFIQQEARIKELESELEIIDKNYRIKKGETWYWEKDSNNYLESLTCPVIINANDLRDLISEARADQNRKIGDYILNIIGKKPHLTPSWLVDLAAKLQKGEF